MKCGLFVLPLFLAACAGAPPRFDSIPTVICEKYLGRGWEIVPAPPANAAHLLGLLDRPVLGSKSAIWYRRPDEATAVCFYGSSVCESEAHVFRPSGADWNNDDSEVAEWICVA